jgi:tRNA modification GTPase
MAAEMSRAPRREPLGAFTISTAAAPGAVGVLTITGEIGSALESITGSRGWRLGDLRLADLAGVDRGVVAIPAPGVALLMPHGGVHVVRSLAVRLARLGLEARRDECPERLFPEAADAFEALALAALARAQSPLAVPLLLDQPRRWRAGGTLAPEDIERSRRLNRLIDPPLVVVCGPPNVGKSTLTNTLIGRTASITAAAAGTTRDYTSARIDLAGLVVHWIDTPGVRTADDPIERKAIELARSVIQKADLLVAVADAAHDWAPVPREPDLRVALRCDLGRRSDAAIKVSAVTGEGISDLVGALRSSLVPPSDLAHPGVWRFDAALPGAGLSMQQK